MASQSLSLVQYSEYDPYLAISLFGHLSRNRQKCVSVAYDIQNFLVLVSRGLRIIAVNMHYAKFTLWTTKLQTLVVRILNVVLLKTRNGAQWRCTQNEEGVGISFETKNYILITFYSYVVVKFDVKYIKQMILCIQVSEQTAFVSTWTLHACIHKVKYTQFNPLISKISKYF